MTSVRHFVKKLFLAAAVFTLALPASAFYTGFENLDKQVSIDLPEDFYVADKTADSLTYQLASEVSSVQAIVRIFKSGEYATSEDALAAVATKLNLNGMTDTVTWRNQKAALGAFTGNLLGVESSVYGVAAFSPKDNAVITMIAWGPVSEADINNVMIASFLDSLCVDLGSYFESGILTAYAYPRLSGAENEVPLELNIQEHKISTKLNKADEEAAQHIVEREYRVLSMYQKSPKWKEAWQRFYRMIYRDSFTRLYSCAFDIYNALAPECTDTTELAQMLLTWTQGFKYEREQNSSDFTSLPSVLLGKGNDCDSRSLLLAVLLRSMNIDSVMFVSNVHSHAIAGLASDHPGFAFTVNGKQFLTGDTTATGATWGKIAQNQADQSNWITVEFP